LNRRFTASVLQNCRREVFAGPAAAESCDPAGCSLLDESPFGHFREPEPNGGSPPPG
jgi:hypothetical protein